MKKKPNWLLIIGLSLGGLCLLGCVVIAGLALFFPSIYHYILENSSLSVGEEAPDFELTTLTGETIRLSQYQGQPVILSIGTSWCPACRAEAPIMEKLHRDHPELIILLIDSQEKSDVVQRFVDEVGITHPVLLDEDGAVTKLYQIFAFPTGIFIDKDGIVRAKIVESATPELLAEKLPLIGVNP